MALNSPHVAVQFPVLRKLGHHGPRVVHYPARAALPVQRARYTVAVGIFAGYCYRASVYGSVV